MSTATEQTDSTEQSSQDIVPAPVPVPAARPNNAAPMVSADRMQTLMNLGNLVPLIIIAAAFVAMAVVGVMWAMEPSYQVLYSNLSDADGGTIIAELDQRQIPYKFSEGGGALLVPSTEVHSLRLQLAEQGLPAGGNVGFELLDNQAFGISQFAEQINYQRGLEGELSRSVEALGPVSQARVHLAMAKPSVFISRQQPAKASVILTLHSGRSLNDSQVSSIVHMVSSSVPELEPDNVSVVDQRGELLSRINRDSSGLDGNQLAYTSQVEDSYHDRVNRILAPLLGEANYRVQVTAEIDFSAVEETSESYAPNQNPANSAIRSSQTSINYTGDEAVASGIPGALSNNVPAFVPSPINAVTPAADGQVAADAQATATVQQDNVINYEVDRNVTHTKRQMGDTERLSIAVVVNNRNSTDEEGNPVSEPRPQEEIDQITRLVMQAVGFSADRGDQVEVINSAFSPIAVIPEPEPIPLWKSPDTITMVQSGLRYFFVGLIILIGYRKILSPVLKRISAPVAPMLSQASAQGNTLAYAGGGSDDDFMAGAAREETPPPRKGPIRKLGKSGTYEEQLNDLKQIGKENPKMVATIVSNWMREDGVGE